MGKYDNARGLIFNIVHGSFVDGWGIRTTIFLKGCPLRCKWCCNPEGQRLAPEMKVTYEDCDGCGDCVSSCPEKALSVENGIIHLDRGACSLCGKCFSACPTDALGIFGRWYTVEEMFDIIVKDKPFYDASGGGLTIGGGEASLYPEFCLGLIERCREAGISAAIDTCGFTVSEAGFEALAAADFLLFDIKGMDETAHIRNTGVSNRPIHENLRRLDALGQQFIIRYPAIPGYNDSDEELRNAARFLRDIKGVRRVDVIPVHRYGENKYRQLDMPYDLSADPIPDDRQEEIRSIFASCGLETQLGG